MIKCHPDLIQLEVGKEFDSYMDQISTNFHKVVNNITVTLPALGE